MFNVGGRESAVTEVKDGRLGLATKGVLGEIERQESHGAGFVCVQLPLGYRMNCIEQVEEGLDGRADEGGDRGGVENFGSCVLGG